MRVYVPYSLICKLNTIKKRNTRSTIEWSNHTKSQQFCFTFHMPPHDFPFRVFQDKVLEDLEKSHKAKQGEYFY